jgi:hypothetical protein
VAAERDGFSAGGVEPAATASSSGSRFTVHNIAYTTFSRPCPFDTILYIQDHLNKGKNHSGADVQLVLQPQPQLVRFCRSLSSAANMHSSADRGHRKLGTD